MQYVKNVTGHPIVVLLVGSHICNRLLAADIHPAL